MGSLTPLRVNRSLQTYRPTLSTNNILKSRLCLSGSQTLPLPLILPIAPLRSFTRVSNSLSLSDMTMPFPPNAFVFSDTESDDPGGGDVGGKAVVVGVGDTTGVVKDAGAKAVEFDLDRVAPESKREMLTESRRLLGPASAMEGVKPATNMSGWG